MAPFTHAAPPAPSALPIHLRELFGVKSKPINEAALPGTRLQSIPGSRAICSTALLTGGNAAFYFILFYNATPTLQITTPW